MPRITREERITFYRMLLQHINAPENGNELNIDTLFADMRDFLNTNLTFKKNFMRLTRVTGKTNLFCARLYRMINDVYHTKHESCHFTF